MIKYTDDVDIHGISISFRMDVTEEETIYDFSKPVVSVNRTPGTQRITGVFINDYFFTLDEWNDLKSYINAHIWHRVGIKNDAISIE